MAAMIALVATTLAAVTLPGGYSRCAVRRITALMPREQGRTPQRRPQSRPEVRPQWQLVAPLGLAVASGVVVGLPFGPALGVTLGAGLWWWLRSRTPAELQLRGHRIEADLPIAVDLLVAALRSGSQQADALAMVARAIGGPLGGELDTAARQLRLGAQPDRAWQQLDEPADLAALGRVLARASRTGAPLADGLAAFASDCRNRQRARHMTRAHRVSVLVVLPLGLCFLPAFVLLGVVPLAVGLISGLELP